MPRQDEPWTVGRLLTWTVPFLAEKRGDEPRTARVDAEVLLAHVLGCKRIDLYGLRHGEEASADVRQRFKDLVRRRVEGCPVAYLVGRKEFFSLEFDVSSAVLIPRPDTEELVNECLRLAKPLEQPHILDLGTGSGCIAVALAKQHKGARLTAVDLDADALDMARRNAEKHGVADRIVFHRGDLFAPLLREARFDFVVSNPPYIPTSEIATLEKGVRDFEPHRALDGGPDGFAVFDRILSGAADYLKPGGYLIVEIGAPQEAEARRRIENVADFALGPTLKDGSGHPRVLRAQLRPSRARSAAE